MFIDALFLPAVGLEQFEFRAVDGQLQCTRRLGLYEQGGVPRQSHRTKRATAD